jgi:hypothetical protein
MLLNIIILGELDRIRSWATHEEAAQMNQAQHIVINLH